MNLPPRAALGIALRDGRRPALQGLGHMFISITSSPNLALPDRFFRRTRLDEQLARNGERCHLIRI
jgi:hypothetical protein